MRRKVVRGQGESWGFLDQVRNDGAWPRVGATEEREGKNGDICHSYVYHMTPVPNVHQNDTTCMATTSIHLMFEVIYMETEALFNNTRFLFRTTALKYCSRHCGRYFSSFTSLGEVSEGSQELFPSAEYYR